MAKDIQLSALPKVFPPFPDEPHFDIWASMATAKEVGGDFYDFYFTGPASVLFLVADVSGKGVPAAMFMMRAKTLIKSIAQTGKPLAQVFDEANEALCEGNSSNTFVTVWAGEINTRTGLVTYVNAGHNPPVLRRGGKSEYLKSQPSLVLGAMAGVRYGHGVQCVVVRQRITYSAPAAFPGAGRGWLRRYQPRSAPARRCARRPPAALRSGTWLTPGRRRPGRCPPASGASHGL